MHKGRIEFDEFEILAEGTEEDPHDRELRKLVVGILGQLNEIFDDEFRDREAMDGSALFRRVASPGGAPSLSRRDAHGRLYVYSDPEFAIADELWLGIQDNATPGDHRLVRVLTGEYAIKLVSSGPTAQVATDDLVKLDATGGAFTYNLLALASAQRKPHYFKRLNAGANPTIDADGAETIDGAGTLVLTGQYQSAILYPDVAAGQWWTL